MQVSNHQLNSVEEKSRAGRPKSDNPRHNRLVLLLTDTELESLSTRAAGKRLTDFARTLVTKT
jgi:hypothetical protein